MITLTKLALTAPPFLLEAAAVVGVPESFRLLRSARGNLHSLYSSGNNTTSLRSIAGNEKRLVGKP